MSAVLCLPRARAQDLEQLGAKAKVQVWSRAGFEEKLVQSSPPPSPTAGDGPAGLTLELAAPAVDLSAAEQRLEEIGDCRYGLWAIGVEENDQGMPFLCAVHPVGVHVTLSAVSGGSFRCRGEQQRDTLYFKDGSSKASSTANAQNVSAVTTLV